MPLKVTKVKNCRETNGMLAMEVECQFSTVGETAPDQPGVCIADHNKMFNKLVKGEDSFRYMIFIPRNTVKELLKEE